MDGGNSLNILYTETLALMGISKSQLRYDASPFHRVVPGHRHHPLGQIDLPVCFGTPDNFRREVLTFNVVGFPRTYLGRRGQCTSLARYSQKTARRSSPSPTQPLPLL